MEKDVVQGRVDIYCGQLEQCADVSRGKVDAPALIPPERLKTVIRANRRPSARRIFKAAVSVVVLLAIALAHWLGLQFILSHAWRKYTISPGYRKAPCLLVSSRLIIRPEQLRIQSFPRGGRDA